MAGRFTGHRRVTWAMLGLYGLVASGMPLPLAAPPPGSAAARALARKDRSRPFPCMDKPCGCDSAERCFTACCCHAPAATLAWARANGTEAAVVDSLARRAADDAAEHREVGPETPSCCQAEAVASCCTQAAPPHDGTAACPERPEPTAADDAAVSRAAGVVTLRAVLACGGIVAQWAAVGASLPPPSRIEFTPLPGLLRVVSCPDARAGGPAAEPAVPPPRGC